MSQDNVELVLRTHAAFSRADLEGFLAGYHPEAEYRAAVTQAVEGDAGDFKGHAGLRRWWRDLHDLYENLKTEIVEVLDLGERVVVVFIVSGRGRGSGIEDGQELAQVVSVTQGKIVVIRDYLSRAEALAAVGLQEWENAEQRGLAEAGFGALNSGDLEAFLALTAEDVEFTSMVAEAEGTTFRGHDGVRAWWETVRGAFEDPQWEVLDIRPSGDRGVIKFRMAGVLAGAHVSQVMWQTSRVRDGKVAWWAFFRTEGEALEAVGVRD